jgi:hypothetical protein
MRSKTAILLAAAASCLCFDAVAERQPIDRYQSIIDRQMFGQPPPNFDPTKPPSQVQKGSGDEKELTREQEAIKSAIHFSAINVTPAGDVAVGFTDNSDSKMPIHYYLKVGEERNGWKVLEADPVKATMKVAKGDIEVALDLGANSAKGGGSTARAGVNAAPAFATANRRTGLLGGRRSSADGEQPRPGMIGASLRERRAARELARQQEEAKEKELEAKRQAEAAEKEKEREAQRQAEKEEQRRELQLLKDELRAQREAVERARAEREAARSNENAEDEN